MIADTGIDLDNVRNTQGQSPITFAAFCQMDNIVNYLSLRAKNLDDEDPEGLTVFARYVLNENFDMATRLLQRGANVNHTNRDGKSTLTLAVQQG